MAAITVTDAARRLYRDSGGGINSITISYIEMGTSSTPPTIGDTHLNAPSFRKAVTSFTNGGAPGELLASVYMGPGDDVGDNIAEIGFWAGNTATGVIGTGVLIAHGLYAHTKLPTESIQFLLDLNVT